MQRHHKGNDFFFALRAPDAFAARYLSFHHDDIAVLCTLCHRRIHKVYEPYIEDFFRQVASKGLSIELCILYKNVCTRIFNEWVKRR